MQLKTVVNVAFDALASGVSMKMTGDPLGAAFPILSQTIRFQLRPGLRGFEIISINNLNLSRKEN